MEDRGADHFGEHGEGPEEEGLNGRSRIFRRSRGEGGQEMLEDRGRPFRRTYDMMQGEGSNGRGVRVKVGNKGKEISEDWGMTFWRPAVGAEHFGEHGAGYFVGEREEKCQKEEQCVQNNLSKTKICFR